MYAIRNKKEDHLLGFSTESSPDGCCTDVIHKFEDSRYCDCVWVVKKHKTAQAVLDRDQDIGWYNATMDTPLWSSSMAPETMCNYEVVELNIATKPYGG